MKKKILALLLALAMVFAFAACGSDNGGSTTPDADNSATPDAGNADNGGKGVLRVGVKNAVVGFGYQDPLTHE